VLPFVRENRSGFADGFRFEGEDAGVGGSFVEMPQRSSVFIRIGTRGEIRIDVLQRRLDPVQHVPDLLERVSTHEHIIF